jgi:hypothetical protein
VLHGANPRGVRRGDLFRELEDDERWDVVLANPPFSVDVSDPAALRLFTLSLGRARVASDVLFLEAAWRRLRPGGMSSPCSPIAPREPGVRGTARVARGAIRAAAISSRRHLPSVRRRGRASSSRWKRPAALNRGSPSTLTPGIRHDPEGLPADGAGRARPAPDRSRRGTVSRRARREGWIPEALDRDTGIANGTRTLGSFALACRCDAAIRRARCTLHRDRPRRHRQGDRRGDRRAREARAPFVDRSRCAPRESSCSAHETHLSNVALVRRPDHGFRRSWSLVEWVRLAPEIHPRFALSPHGHVRASADLVDRGTDAPADPTADLDEVEVPDPGETARGRSSDRQQGARCAVGSTPMLVRRRALRAFGKGELSEDALLALRASSDPWRAHSLFTARERRAATLRARAGVCFG